MGRWSRGLWVLLVGSGMLWIPSHPAVAESRTTDAQALATARSTHSRVLLPDRTTATGLTYANPNGTFTLELNVSAVRQRKGAGWVPVEAAAPGTVKPNLGAGLNGFAEVYLQHANNSYWGGDGDNVAKVGYVDDEGPVVTVRSYFQFDTSAVAGKDIISAEFNDRENHAFSCVATEMDAYETGRIDSHLTWNNQPANPVRIWNASFAHGHGAACPAQNIGFDASRPVREGQGAATIMLAAANESDDYFWKKFDTNPQLVIDYNSVPDAPSGMATDDHTCSQYPDQAYVADATPTLRATLTDQDGNQVRAHFQWWVRSGAMVGEATTAYQPSGTQFSVPIPAGAYSDGAIIAWLVQADDGRDTGPLTWCDASVDVTRPGSPPTVTSADFPTGAVGLGVGQTGTFTLAAAGVGDVAGYRYSLIDPPGAYVSASAPGGTATVGVSPTRDGPNTLYVQSVDRAGNVSDVGRYSFVVGAATPSAGHWRLDGYWPDTSVPDGSGHGHDGTVQGGAPSWTSGRVGDAVQFNGSSTYVSTVGGPAVHADRTFSVSAWVWLDAAGDDWRTAVSEDGDRMSAFYLQYRGDTHKWDLAMPQSDMDGTDVDRVSSLAPAQTGLWTYLVGTYDAGSATMALYVNGVPQGTAHHAPSFDATGGVQFGRAKFVGDAVDWWTGRIDEVQLYDRVLTSGTANPDQDTAATEVHNLATAPTLEEGFWPLDERTGTVGTDLSGTDRSALASGGVSWVPGGAGPGAVSLDGSSGYLDAGEPAVRNDGSFTVSALVDLRDDGSTGDQAVVSQDGSRSSGFVLGLRGGHWSFSVAGQDANTPNWTTVSATDPPARAEWVGLAGVYDAAAQQLRLYVDGQLVNAVPVTAVANVDGDLILGRAQKSGQPAWYWHGNLDDVHVYTGARTGAQIQGEYVTPVTTASTVYSGQLTRWIDASGAHHAVSSGPIPRGMHLERSMGVLASPGTQGTHMLYSCEYPGGQFANLDTACGGYRYVAPIGLLYDNPPTGQPYLPVYRCLQQGNGDHFMSPDPKCEGQIAEGLYGYTLAYADLIRYRQPDAPGGHLSSTGAVPGGHIPASYQPEGSLALIGLPGLPGTVNLMSCTTGTDIFSSTDPSCEGKKVVGVVGAVWSAAPAGGHATAVLRRCRIAGGSQLFDSLDPYCEGQQLDKTLGYVITRL